MSDDTEPRHEWDDDGCCIHCGFDGAEWWHWKHNTYEGRASDKKEPPCKRRDTQNGSGGRGPTPSTTGSMNTPAKT